MIQFASLSEFTDYTQIRKCWNDEMQKIYPISEKLFLGSVINNKEIMQDYSYVALEENTVIGFILAKTWNDVDMVPYYNPIGWISLFFVKKQYRKQGIGTQLLNFVETAFKELGKSKIILGCDTYNFFPGLPVDLVNNKKWFLTRGFTAEGENFDMIRTFKKGEPLLPIPETQYEVRMAKRDDREAIFKFFERCFKGRWEYEVKNYFNNGGTGREFAIALDGDKVIAFSRINDKESPEVLYNINWSERFNNLIGVGPLGVDPSYRKQKLGYIITAYAINEAQKRNCSECIIDWTGLVDFYRLFHFEVWKTSYKLEKKI